MSDRSRLALLVGMVATVTLGCSGDDDAGDTTSVAAVTTDGSSSPADEPLDDVLLDTLRGLWSAAGIEDDQVQIDDYRFRSEPDSTSCADLSADDRWLATRHSSAPAGLGSQAQIEEAFATHLTERGFEVQRFRSTLASDPARAIEASNDDVRVLGLLGPDGFTDINVQAGPCAPTFGGLGDGFEPDA